MDDRKGDAELADAACGKPFGTYGLLGIAGTGSRGKLPSR